MNVERIEPGEGQESVWDYPRPPRLERSADQIRVVDSGRTIADSRSTFRVLETSHPPVYYIPPTDIDFSCLVESDHGTFCEWKGHAHYFSLQRPDAHGVIRSITNVAWTYPQPTAKFSEIAHYVAFYPSKVEACYVNEERVQPQPGDFYGGWMNSRIVGPIKGGPGTMGW